MWLLNTHSLRLEQFYDQIPEYAILSHRWEYGQEVEFGDVTASSAHLRGHRKMIYFCEMARQEGFNYAWADTCCIDQKSSAELSEAINSMFKWYRHATMCFVYLADVHCLDIVDVNDVDLSNSTWFTRGWTLQELLAPSNLAFFDHSWNLLGSKLSLANKLENITGIPSAALLKFDGTRYCVAEKMSWAANRRTTREEDRAYSLLGLFDVNMPMLYGEGVKAFQRLQEEIMRTSTDTSLFLWKGNACKNFGMLASDPSCFFNFKDLPRAYQPPFPREKFDSERGWTLTNTGIDIKDAMLQPFLVTDDYETIYTVSLIDPPLLGFYVRLDKSTRYMTYRRVSINGTASTEIRERSQRIVYVAGSRISDIVISRAPLEEKAATDSRGFLVSLQSRGLENVRCTAHSRPEGRDLLHEWPADSTMTLGTPFLVNPADNEGLLGYLRINFGRRHDLLICLGFNFNLKPFCVVVPFCSQLYNGKRLRSHDILALYYTLSSRNSKAAALPLRGVLFDEASQIMTMTDAMEDYRAFQEFNLGIQINNSRESNALYQVDIELHPNKFQYSVEAENLGSVSDMFQSTLGIEFTLEASRHELMPRAFAGPNSLKATVPNAH